MIFVYGTVYDVVMPFVCRSHCPGQRVCCPHQPAAPHPAASHSWHCGPQGAGRCGRRLQSHEPPHGPQRPWGRQLRGCGCQPPAVPAGAAAHAARAAAGEPRTELRHAGKGERALGTAFRRAGAAVRGTQACMPSTSVFMAKARGKEPRQVAMLVHFMLLYHMYVLRVAWSCFLAEVAARAPDGEPRPGRLCAHEPDR